MSNQLNIASDILEGLNPSQTEAVTCLQGVCEVIAGPGSGKTHVLTKRILHLVVDKQVPPESILVITFTKAAALNMKNRFEQLQGGISRVYFATFHSFFYHIINDYYHRIIPIINEKTKQIILSNLMKENHISESYAEILQLIANPFNLENSIQTICSQYEQYLEDNGFMDLSYLDKKCLQIFNEDIRCLVRWQSQFQHVMIDEFQDINALQFAIIQRLCEKVKSLFVVGDDDQSIYGFRGSKPEIMKQMAEIYPDIHRVYMCENYRSDQQIVQASNRIIAQNEMRFDKEIQSLSSMKGELLISAYTSREEECDKVCVQVAQMFLEGKKSIAILCRRTNDMLAFMYRLRLLDIPYVLNQKLHGLNESEAINDIWTYLQIAYGDADRKKVLRIINRPTRYIERRAFGESRVDFSKVKIYYKDNPRKRMQIIELEQSLIRLRKLPLHLAISYIRKGMEYDRYIMSESGYSMEKILQEMEHMELLEKLSKHVSTMEEMEMLLQSESRIADVEFKEKNANCVSIYTMHASKGLEFDTVFVPLINRDVIPGKKSVTAEQIEEERRLLYVAMTRAKHSLYLSYVKEGKKYEPSILLKPIL